MFFPGISQDPANQGKEEHVMPTMIYCGGNAMFYENWQFDSDWLDFYRNNGINVFAWNYRGYGGSEGSPNPSKMYDDGEMVVEYLRNNRGIQQSKVCIANFIEIGVHGQSLGGAVAAHLARNCNMDFVLIDRSFSSLAKVVEYSYGRIANILLNILTFFTWKLDTTNNYIYANTYKVIAYDPKDEVIPELSSVKNGVAQEIIFAEATRKENRISIGPNKRREAKAIDMSEYCHIINKEETKGFFFALKHVYKMILTYGSSDVKRGRKSLTKSMKELADSNSNMNVKARNEHSPDADDEAAVLNRPSTLETDRSLALNGLLETEENDESFDISRGLSFSYMEDNDTSMTEESQDVNKQARKEHKRRIRKEKFTVFDDKRDPTDYDLINRFLLRAHKYLDKLDSAGQTFRHIFESGEKVQLDQFRYFIMNLEIYGSFMPLNDRMHDLQVTRISSYLKVSKARKGLDSLINEYEDIEGKVFKDVWLKIRMVSYYLNKIEAFLSRKHKQSSNKSKEKMQFCIDYELDQNHKEEDKDGQITEFESSYGDGTKMSTPRSGLSVIEDDEDEYYYTRTLFNDFTEPEVIKTGYILPVS
jgi:hypothetical protein